MPNKYTKNSIPLADRFWSKVDKSGDCWLWTGTTNKGTGYGYMKIDRHHVDAHRVSYQVNIGPIPPGHCVCHSCDANYPPGDTRYRRCVRPDHLFLGTQADNLRDMAAKKRSCLGDRNGSRLHPERRSHGPVHAALVRQGSPRGERHWQKRHPELRVKGERIGTAKLTTEQVVEIRRAYAAKEASQAALAAKFAITQSTVSLIVLGKRWHDSTD